MTEQKQQELLAYYDELSRLAGRKCTSQSDAEDLVSETMLAAFSYLHRGGKIENPKTWLHSTLLHKWNSALRRKYRTPQTVCIDRFFDLSEEESADALCFSDEGEGVESYLATDEGAEVRRTLTYLAKTTRTVLIRHYYNGESIPEIAAALGIPEGTVKSRLYAGREQMKKGLIETETKKNHIPETLHLYYIGRDGKNSAPVSLTENDLIAQNLLILAYEKPLHARELAELLGIPTVYIEPILEKLYEGELMGKTEMGKYYTDFLIHQPKKTDSFQKQLAFAEANFELIWSPITRMLQKIDAMPYTKTLTPRKKEKLCRFAVLRVLQSYTLNVFGNPETPPPRKDGGAWIAGGIRYLPEHDFKKATPADGYHIYNGHRQNTHTMPFQGASYLSLHEFDTDFYDNPCRYNMFMEEYFEGMPELLWCIHRGLSPENKRIANRLIENIPHFVQNTGLLAYENGVLSVDIPLMDKSTYSLFALLIRKTTDALFELAGEALQSFLRGTALKPPPHIKNIPTAWLYEPCTRYLPMMLSRLAWERGLHMQGVDYCCPPVLMVYEEEPA